MYKVYSTNKSNRKMIDKILSDDVLGRQSVNYREGSSFGLSGDLLIVVIEGSSEIFDRVKDIVGDSFEELEEKKSAEIYKKIKDEESEAESGMGFIFD